MSFKGMDKNDPLYDPDDDPEVQLQAIATSVDEAAKLTSYHFLEEKAKLSGVSSAQLLSFKKRALFVEALAQTGNVTMAARSVGWCRGTPYDLRETDELFAEAWEEAVAISVDMLEGQAWNLAMNGVKEPVFHNGEQCGFKIKYSERMLEILLKARRPDIYRENVKMEHDVKGGVLVVPGMANVDDWEAQAKEQQAEHRSNTAGDIIDG